MIKFPDLKFSYFKSPIKNTTPESVISLDKFLEDIQSSKYKTVIEKLRINPESNIKTESLDYVTLSVITDKRGNKPKEYSGMIQIDLDKLEDIQSTKELLSRDPYLIFLAISPSGNGIKSAIYHSGGIQQHETAFRQIEIYFKQTYNITIDKSVKDSNRAFFVTYDPNLWRNQNPKEFIIDIPATEQTPKATNNVYSSSNQTLESRILNTIDNILSTATNGNRHESRAKASYLAGGYSSGGLIPESTIWNHLLYISDRISDGGKTPESEIQTLKTCFDKGKSRPIQQYSNNELKSRRYAGIKFNPETGEIFQQSETDRIEECFFGGDFGFAELIYDILQNEYCYNATTGIWYKYLNGIWTEDIHNSIRATAKDILIDKFTFLINQTSQQLKLHSDNETTVKIITEKIDKLNRGIKAIPFTNRINNVVKEAQSFFTVQTTDFDSDPFLINLQNGTYELKQNIFRKHTPADLLSKQTGTAYNPKATCNKWIQFLDKIFDSDHELISFVQKIMGVCLTGTSDFQYFVFCYGSGANGKSTLFNVMQKLLNPANNNSDGYYFKIEIGSLLIQNNQKTDLTAIARMYGKRLVIATEIPDESRLNETLIKELTGSETLSARELYGKAFNFQPTHKLILFGQYKPMVKDNSNGFWRRAILIPFEVTIPESEQRPQNELMEEFLEELDGIFNWCLEGWKSYQQQPIKKSNFPTKVLNAISEYQQESDILLEFLQTNELLHQETGNMNLKIEISVLWEIFRQWTEKNNRSNPYITNRKFNKDIEQKGFRKQKGTDNKTFFYGISVKE